MAWIQGYKLKAQELPGQGGMNGAVQGRQPVSLVDKGAKDRMWSLLQHGPEGRAESQACL